MKIILLQIGKTTENYLLEGINKYTKRINHYSNFEIITINPGKTNSQNNIQQIKKQDSDLLISKIENNDFVVLLDEQGKELSSVNFAAYLENHLLKSTKRLVFVIGGAYGFSDELYKRADYTLSLSKLTFSHQMVRLFFVEQIYRAFTIIKGESYHHS
ncbi:MAG: 23S rRNA (pseudouridine(1915)-N(3))-methyltransferase RlmH [Bacteroidia bacterium]|nr:23S rRNA (pseudouridine(1915)-N(3))-methyltransferase RlmH [Bacteroidia bacterium]MCZ2248828.1 23S rRNA (pseudouridine(1915)-N(3))-methyltransferase RlmH [Bacteroidia bacterium]